MARKFWEFRNTSEEEAELLLYGEIASEQPWWDGGDTVTPRQFYEDLKILGSKSGITVRINSVGGDVFAAQAIYTQLKTNPAKITVIVDGLAASAASIIAMAGDVVKMPANAMMMIHNPMLGLVGYFTADEMEKFAEQLDAVKESIINAYIAKTGLDRKTLSKMMDEETWMTGQEAVEKGFADEVLFQDMQVAANGNLLVVNNITHDLSKFKKRPSYCGLLTIKDGVIPDDVSREKASEDEPWEAPKLEDFTEKSWDDLSDDEKRKIAGHYAWSPKMPPDKFSDLKLPHHRPSDGAVVWAGVVNAGARLSQTDIPDEDVEKVREHLGSHYKQFGRTPPWEEEKKGNAHRKEENELQIKTVEDLKQHFPELITQIESVAREEGARNERERIKAIDEIGCVLAPDLVNKAKYEQPMTAAQLALEAVKLDAVKGRKYLEDIARDKAESGVVKVIGQPADSPENWRETTAKAIADFVNERRKR